MRLVVTLLVRDEVDIVAATIEHHLAQGAALVVVTDNGSVDGTTEVLSRYARSGVVDLVHEPDHTYRQAEWVTRMARRAATVHDADWVVNIDADEFWAPVDGRRSLHGVLAGIPAQYGAVTAWRSDLLGRPAGPEVPWPERLRWRNLRTVSERGTPLSPKVCHRGSPDVSVVQGNHAVSGTGLEMFPGEPITVRHVPLRSWPQFARKIRNGGSSYAANSELAPDIGWHWRADYERLLAGRLAEAYEQRQLSRRALVRGVLRGTLRRDSTLLRSLHRLEAQAVHPDLLRAVLAGTAGDAGRAWADRPVRVGPRVRSDVVGQRPVGARVGQRLAEH